MKTLNYSVRARGWLRDYMRREVQLNVVGKLEFLAKDMFDDDIFVQDRISKNTKPKNLGTVENDEEWNAQFYWWNGETIGNYYDGLLRYGYLLDDEDLINQAEGFVHHVLKNQDKDGYLGIYSEDTRYNFDTENGELWTKTTLYRVLLGYYFYTKNEKVLVAVIRAVHNVMSHYKIHTSTPFAGKKTFAGVTHGLMFVDILHTLYEVTKDYKYIEYAIFLYEDYNKHEVSEPDVLAKNLRDPEYMFWGHGVHVYEHLRVIAIVSKYTKQYKDLYALYMEKLEKVLTPSAGPIGDEWVMKNIANANDYGYEFCSIHELMDSLLFVSSIGLDDQYTLANKIFKNANFGARHNEELTISYLKSDNSFSMTGDFQTKQEHSPHQIQTRYKYSPTHQDAAVCCVPNAVRISPYFIEHALTITDQVKINYIVPLKAVITMAGKRYSLEIKQEKMFGEYEIKTNLGDLLVKPTLNESSEILVKEDHDGWVYFEKDNIVYALPLEYKSEHVKDYPFDVYDTHVTMLEDKEQYCYQGAIPRMDGDTLIVTMHNGVKEVELQLIPIAHTVLRQVTFQRG